MNPHLIRNQVKIEVSESTIHDKYWKFQGSSQALEKS